MNKRRSLAIRRRLANSRVIFPRKRTSVLNNLEQIPYKDIELLKRYLTDKGRILPRRITGNTAWAQRNLQQAIKRARNIALISFSDGYVPQEEPQPIQQSYRPMGGKPGYRQQRDGGEGSERPERTDYDRPARAERSDTAEVEQETPEIAP